MRKIRAALICMAAGLALHVPVVVAAPVEATAGPVDKSDVPEHVHPKINHVLIISEDGLRADAVATLHLKWHDLNHQRGSYSDHALTIRDASTLPAHASMLSGVEPNEHGLTWNTCRPRGAFLKAPGNSA